ncbi:hypothetical protein BU14_0626s0001, partial [Porphyra umbilicalis]
AGGAGAPTGGATPEPPPPPPPTDTREPPLVHFGFLRGYASVREPLLAELSALTGGLGGDWEVYYTGHSLGGALATLAAADVRARHPASRAVLVSFGQPKVGNGAFRAAVNALLPAAFRVVNDVDIVARAPAGSYRHVGRTVLVNAAGNLWVEGAGDPVAAVAAADGGGGGDGDGAGGDGAAGPAAAAAAAAATATASGEPASPANGVTPPPPPPPRRPTSSASGGRPWSTSSLRRRRCGRRSRLGIPCRNTSKTPTSPPSA